MSASSPAVRPTGVAQITWSRAFPATPQQVGEARRFLAAILDGRSAADDAVLCLSELASNAVLHSHSAAPGARFTVRATLKNDQLRVEVSDDGGPWHRTDRDDDQHGRGLVIVSHLATAWGRAGTPNTGWTVWYTIKCPPVRLARPWTTVIDGQRLRQLRRERVLTQMELAGKISQELRCQAATED